MSRIGRSPIPLPAGVEFHCDAAVVTVKGPKGELSQRVPSEMLVEVGDDVVTVKRPSDAGTHRSLHGLTRSLIANMVEGVTNGFEKRLEIVGVGYRAGLKGKNLELQVGFSHPVVVEPPDGIEFETPQPTAILVRGIDKQAVGEIAAQVRALRPPEPYKGKGIRYAGEYVARKVGKRA
jgi:large subunit ribosomal protein L6